MVSQLAHFVKNSHITIVASLLHLISPVGVPGQGGDYVPPVENTFVFDVGAARVCRQAFVFDDDRFEMSEQFSVQYTGIVLPDGTATPSVPGVMVQPSTATVLILDNDGNNNYYHCSLL